MEKPDFESALYSTSIKVRWF